MTRTLRNCPISRVHGELWAAACNSFGPYSIWRRIYHETVEEARAQIQHLARRPPAMVGAALARWTLTSLQLACPWFRDLSLSGAHRLLDRLDVVWKRGRASVLSPDPQYDAKLVYLDTLRQLTAAQPERLVLAYLDEVTIERQPTLAAVVFPRGHDQPRACRSHATDTLTRVVASLTYGTGQVVFRLLDAVFACGPVALFIAAHTPGRHDARGQSQHVVDSARSWHSRPASRSYRAAQPETRCYGTARVGAAVPVQGKKWSSAAITPVQPVWWLAPIPAPLSPWKYS